MTTIRRTMLAAMALVLCHLAAAQPVNPPEIALNIDAQPLVDALHAFANQTGLQVLVNTDEVKAGKVRSPKVVGTFTAGAGLKELLAGSGLKFEFVNERTVRIAPVHGGAQTSSSLHDGKELLAQVGSAMDAMEEVENTGESLQNSSKGSEASGEASSEARAIPEILVRGSRTLNMDIARTRDDALPYVVFGRDAIANSGASNLEEFLRQRLPMNSTALTESQASSNLGARSKIDLRGLGANQTLILVDGHRLSGTVSVGSPSQPDINGVPLSAIERIEILPTSASGIYGGGATGGVINIVMRRDYTGVETKLGYSDTTDSRSSTRRIEVSAGTKLFNGKTDVLFAGSASDSNPLLTEDREFFDRGVINVLANNPTYFSSMFLPPVGSTTNIISANGTPLVLKNNTPLNSTTTHIPDGYAGPAGDQGQALVANAGKYNLATAHTVMSGTYPLLNAPQVQTLMLTVRQQLSNRMEGFLELNGSNNKGRFSRAQVGSVPFFTLQANNPNNPFQQPIRIVTPWYGLEENANTSESRERRMVAGVIARLAWDWKAEFDYTLHKVNLDARTTVMNDAAVAQLNAGIANGGINLMRDTRLSPVDVAQYFDQADLRVSSRSEMSDITARFSGPVGRLPAGRPTLAALVEYRDQEYGGTASGTEQPQTQKVRSAYMEATVPLVSTDFHWPIVRNLQLHAAGRWDSYETSGMSIANPFFPSTSGRNTVSSVNPSLGLRWTLNPDIMIRTSYQTGFLAPDVNQLAATSFDAVGGFIDPLRNETLGAWTELFGGNADLKPEDSATWSAGAILTPEVVPGLRFSVDWSRIRKTNALTNPDIFDMLLHPENYPGRIVRGAPDGNPSGLGPITSINGGLINMASAVIESIDSSLSYSRDYPLGNIELFANATYGMSFREQLRSDLPVVEHLGTVNSGQGGHGYPVRWRGTAGGIWSQGPVKAGWSMRYIHGYAIEYPLPSVVIAQGNGGKVDEQIYHDLFVTYLFGAHSAVQSSSWRRAFSDAEARLGVNNVFNTQPPFDASNTKAFYSGFADPRLRYYTASLKLRF